MPASHINNLYQLWLFCLPNLFHNHYQHDYTNIPCTCSPPRWLFQSGPPHTMISILLYSHRIILFSNFMCLRLPQLVSKSIYSRHACPRFRAHMSIIAQRAATYLKLPRAHSTQSWPTKTFRLSNIESMGSSIIKITYLVLTSITFTYLKIARPSGDISCSSFRNCNC